MNHLCCAGPGRLRHSFDMQNAGEFGLVPVSEMLTAFRPMLIPSLDPISHLSLTLPFSIPQTVPSSLSSPSNHITGARDHTSTQVDTASSASFMANLKTYIFRAI